MKIDTILTAAVVYAGLGLAIPHGIGHLHHALHAKRAMATTYSTVTDIVTITDYNAIVWVDANGNVIRTEHKTPSTATSTSSTVTDAGSTPTVPAYSAASSNTLDNTIPSVSTPTSTVKSTIPASSAVSIPPESATTVITSSQSVSLDTTPAQSSSAPAVVTKIPSTDGTVPGFGIAFDAWSGSGCRPTLDSDFAFLSSQGASKIRVYDVCFAESVNAAAAHNLKLMVGLTSFNDFDSKLNDLVNQITSTQAGWTVVDTVFIGNELVNDGLATPQTVADHVSIARGILKTKGYTGSVVAVDTWIKMRDEPVICSTSDYCAANAHAFFDGNVLPSNAGSFIRDAYNAIAATNNGKHVVITESGWPHAGAPNGVSIADIDSQRTALESIVRAFSGDSADMFLFMAYDATYKTDQPEVERSFGIFDSTHYDGTP